LPARLCLPQRMHCPPLWPKLCDTRVISCHEPDPLLCFYVSRMSEPAFASTGRHNKHPPFETITIGQQRLVGRGCSALHSQSKGPGAQAIQRPGRPSTSGWTASSEA
jgi:hypothetical protein